MIEDLAIDARMYRSGLGVYTRNLVQQLYEGFAWPMHGITRSDQAERFSPFCSRLSIVDAPMYSIREQFAVARAARRDRILHVPHYNIPLLYRGILLATIHDLTHVLDRNYRNSLKSRIYGAPMLAACARRADHLFTVSEYSKSRIVDRLDVDPEKISVVYNGVGPEFYPGDIAAAREAIRQRFGLIHPFVLYVGNLKPHKNVEGLVQAFSKWKNQAGANYDLVLIGNDRSGEGPIRESAVRLGITPHFVADANNTEVAHFYRAAEVLVLPSFEEGFGLPVIEAMACGTPVICSDRSALPEVTGDAALLFNPDDIDQLAQLFDTLLSAPELRESLREKGLLRAARYTWRETARRHADVYRRYTN